MLIDALGEGADAGRAEDARFLALPQRQWQAYLVAHNSKPHCCVLRCPASDSEKEELVLVRLWKMAAAVSTFSTAAYASKFSFVSLSIKQAFYCLGRIVLTEPADTLLNGRCNRRVSLKRALRPLRLVADRPHRCQ